MALSSSDRPAVNINALVQRKKAQALYLTIGNYRSRISAMGEYSFRPTCG